MARSKRESLSPEWSPAFTRLRCSTEIRMEVITRSPEATARSPFRPPFPTGRIPLKRNSRTCGWHCVCFSQSVHSHAQGHVFGASGFWKNFAAGNCGRGLRAEEIRRSADHAGPQSGGKIQHEPNSFVEQGGRQEPASCRDRHGVSAVRRRRWRGLVDRLG